MDFLKYEMSVMYMRTTSFVKKNDGRYEDILNGTDLLLKSDEKYVDILNGTDLL